MFHIVNKLLAAVAHLTGLLSVHQAVPSARYRLLIIESSLDRYVSCSNAGLAPQSVSSSALVSPQY
jgi:hypothetical protein